MKCPSCGAAKLVRDRREDLHLQGRDDLHSGRERRLLPGLRRGRAGHGRISPNQRGHAGVQQAGECRHRRSGIHRQREEEKRLDQQQAAEIFGGGVNAFSRYENGRTRPPLALVKLLKVLDRHPDLLDEVRAA